jgi:hypothetical protein
MTLVFSFLGLIIVLFIAIPLGKMIFGNNPAILWDTVTDTQVISSIWLTLYSALIATVIGCVLGVPLAYLLSRHTFPGKRVLEGIIDIPVVVPHTAAGIALLFVFGRNFLLGKAFNNIGISFIDSLAGIVIAMLDTSQNLKECALELGTSVEQLLTPLTHFLHKDSSCNFAIDNGAYSEFKEKSFLSLLDRQWDFRDKCRFVAVPDIPESARRTLESFEYWADRLPGWKLAFVVQDGQENLPIPWEAIDAIFIGGSTAWKVGIHAQRIIKTAHIWHKWIHAGRVNTPARFEYFESLGVDSIDGTGLSRFSWMRKAIYDREKQLKLYEEKTA